MTVHQSIDITLLRPSMLPSVAEGYRQIAEANRYLFAQTQTARFREIAQHAEDKVAECERESVIRWEVS